MTSFRFVSFRFEFASTSPESSPHPTGAEHSLPTVVASNVGRGAAPVLVPASRSRVHDGVVVAVGRHGPGGVHGGAPGGVPFGILRGAVQGVPGKREQ